MQDWPVLKTLWQRHCDPAYQADARASMEWEQQIQALYANQIAHPAALRFFAQKRPTLEEFQDWIASTSAQYVVAEHEPETEDDNYRLSSEQIAFWQENGYLILPKVIDAAVCCQLRRHLAIRDAARAIELVSTQCIQHGLMLPLYNHPQLNSNRASKRIRAASCAALR
jgi:hypothetical protein